MLTFPSGRFPLPFPSFSTGVVDDCEGPPCSSRSPRSSPLPVLHNYGIVWYEIPLSRQYELPFGTKYISVQNKNRYEIQFGMKYRLVRNTMRFPLLLHVTVTVHDSHTASVSVQLMPMAKLRRRARSMAPGAEVAPITQRDRCPWHRGPTAIGAEVWVLFILITLAH